MNEAAREEEKPEARCSRPYRLGQRAVNMDETRARILAAARELILGESALSGFSMENVAKQAGVTRVTIYNRFSSRRGLLEALLDEVGARGNLGERIPQVFAIPDAREALRRYIEIFCEFWDGDRALNRRLRGFAALDAEFASAIESRYERRYHAIKMLLHRLKPDLSPDALEAEIQTALALTGFAFYDALAGETRGAGEVASLVFHLVVAALEPQEKVRPSDGK